MVSSWAWAYEVTEILTQSIEEVSFVWGLEWPHKQLGIRFL